MNNYFDGSGMFDSFENMYQNSISSEKNDMKLMKRLKKQAGDNMNFNKCGYNGSTEPSKLFDVYNGFIRGNMFPDLFNNYKISRPYDVKPMNEQAELLTKVDAYCFAAHDLNLYLDTHPYDRDMIDLFKELSQDSDMANREYEDKYGPLFVGSNKEYPWAWNDSPWPWENN